MEISHFEIFVEEPSMEKVLSVILPKMIGERTFTIYVHRGKFALLKKLPERLEAYKTWLPEDWRILLIIDRDQEDCIELKSRVEKIVTNAGLKNRQKNGNDVFHVLTRIAIEELEAWYFGDWDAVRLAYPNVPEKAIRTAKFRDPDAIKGGTWEAFERIMKRAGYFQGGLRKIEAAQHIAPYLRPEDNLSGSFQVLRSALSNH